MEYFAQLLQDRFRGRRDAFLSERRRAVYEPLDGEVLRRHLLGEDRIGIYQNDTTSYIGLDFDGKNPKIEPIGREGAWSQVRSVLAVIEQMGLPAPAVELTRSGVGYRILLFTDAADPPTVVEAHAFGLLLLHAAQLPDDEDEENGHPGVYPDPPGPKGLGRTVYMPWGGLLSGKQSSIFVDQDGAAMDLQETVLEQITPITREWVLRASTELTKMAGTEPKPIVDAAWSELTPDETPANRHKALCSMALSLARNYPLQTTQALVHGLAGRWGLLPERKDEVDHLVTSAYSKVGEGAARQRPSICPRDFTEVTDPNAGKVTWLFEELIPLSVITLLAAAPKVGKSIVTYALTRAALRGEPAFGRYPIDGPARVAVFQFEMPFAEDLRRLRKLCIGGDSDPAELIDFASDGRLVFFSRPPLDLGDREGREIFHDCVRRNASRLVVVDSATAAFAGQDLNDGSTVRRLMTDAFLPLTSEGRSVILLHHYRKPQGTGPNDEKAAVANSMQFAAASGRSMASRAFGPIRRPRIPTVLKCSSSPSGPGARSRTR